MRKWFFAFLLLVISYPAMAQVRLSTAPDIFELAELVKKADAGHFIERQLDHPGREDGYGDPYGYQVRFYFEDVTYDIAYNWSVGGFIVSAEGVEDGVPYMDFYYDSGPIPNLLMDSGERAGKFGWDRNDPENEALAPSVVEARRAFLQRRYERAISALLRVVGLPPSRI